MPSIILQLFIRIKFSVFLVECRLLYQLLMFVYFQTFISIVYRLLRVIQYTETFLSSTPLKSEHFQLPQQKYKQIIGVITFE